VGYRERYGGIYRPELEGHVSGRAALTTRYLISGFSSTWYSHCFLRIRPLSVPLVLSGSDGLAAILGTFGGQNLLKTINLARNDRVGPSFDFFTHTMSLHPIFRSVTDLNLSDCQLDAKSCTTLLRAMKPTDPHGPTTDQKPRNLVLNLNSNDLSDADNLQELMRLVTETSIVSELSMSKCNIGDAGIKVTADQFFRGKLLVAGSHQLSKLDVSHNNLSPRGIEYFASALRSQGSGIMCSHALTNLQTFNLAGNSLDDKSCHELAAAIGSMKLPLLEELDVSQTACGATGARALLCSSVATSLTTLNLFGNQLGSDGFLELSKAVRRGCYSLQVLDLGGNDASEAGVVSLLQAFLNEEEEKAPEKRPEFSLRLLVVGGNHGGPTLERVVEGIRVVHPELDIARDKPRRSG
jgi:hypothetical protein